MEAHHDLRKFITESPVAQRGVMLSSGREADGGAGQSRVTMQHREIVGRLTPWAGIKSSTAMGSDQTAAEALQEAETEVGVTEMIDLGGRAAARAGGSAYRSADPLTGFGLTA